MHLTLDHWEKEREQYTKTKKKQKQYKKQRKKGKKEQNNEKAKDCIGYGCVYIRFIK